MILVIDNFLKDPDAIREVALKQKYLSDKQASKKHGVEVFFPGVRTESVLDIYSEYGKESILVVMNHLNRYMKEGQKYTSTFFQICKEKDNAWIHRDQSAIFAAVLYLTPNAPYNSGTIIYDENKIEVDNIANKYNRLIIYNADSFHKANEYFGKTKKDSRLTQVFFIYDHLNRFTKDEYKS
jgi:hypothetical protein